MARLIITSLSVFALLACSGSGTTNPDASTGADAKVAQSDSKTTQSDMSAKADQKAAQDDASSSAAACKDIGKLAQDALTNGKKVFNGVTLKTSIAIFTSRSETTMTRQPIV